MNEIGPELQVKVDVFIENFSKDIKGSEPSKFETVSYNLLKWTYSFEILSSYFAFKNPIVTLYLQILQDFVGHEVSLCWIIWDFEVNIRFKRSVKTIFSFHNADNPFY